MIEVADLGSKEQPPSSLRMRTWLGGHSSIHGKGMWEMVRRVYRWNFGVCLDTFNIVGRVWADPQREDGMAEQDPGERMAGSLKRMVKEVDVTNVWYAQVVAQSGCRSRWCRGMIGMWKVSLPGWAGRGMQGCFM